MQVLQLRIADALEDEVLGQALAEDGVRADGVEMRQAFGHSGSGLGGAFPVPGFRRSGARLLREFRLAQPIALAFNGNNLGMMGEPINQRLMHRGHPDAIFARRKLAQVYVRRLPPNWKKPRNSVLRGRHTNCSWQRHVHF
jgi:hypothetical protein